MEGHARGKMNIVFIDKYVDFEADFFNEIIGQIANEKGQWVLDKVGGNNSEEII